MEDLVTPLQSNGTFCRINLRGPNSITRSYHHSGTINQEINEENLPTSQYLAMVPVPTQKFSPVTDLQISMIDGAMSVVCNSILQCRFCFSFFLGTSQEGWTYERPNICRREHPHTLERGKGEDLGIDHWRWGRNEIPDLWAISPRVLFNIAIPLSIIKKSFTLIRAKRTVYLIILKISDFTILVIFL